MKRVSVLAIVPAAGSGSRLRSRVPKPLVDLGGEPIFVRTLRALRSAYSYERVVMPVDPSLLKVVARLLLRFRLKDVELCVGGATRAESVRRGLDWKPGAERLVLVHDAARPFVSADEVRSVIRAADERGAAILAQQATSTIKEADPKSGRIVKTRDRRRTWLAQTPQVARASWLRNAYERLGTRAASFTDEASLVEASGKPVYVVPGSSFNFKITTPEDLKLARALIKAKIR